MNLKMKWIGESYFTLDIYVDCRHFFFKELHDIVLFSGWMKFCKMKMLKNQKKRKKIL